MQGSRGQDTLYDFIAIVMLGFSALVVIVVALLLLNPNAAYNPFPPGEGAMEPLPTVFEMAPGTPTPEPPALPPTWTASPSPTGGPTITASSTMTITATATATTTKVFTPTRTPTASPTGPTATLTPTESAFPYVLQPGTPRLTSYFGGPNPDTYCDWSGLAGQVFGLSGSIGEVGTIVHVTGSGVDEEATSGAYAGTYGSGGWEVSVHVKPVARSYTVRVENSLGEALSEDVEVTTGDTCDTNLTIVNFLRAH